MALKRGRPPKNTTPVDFIFDDKSEPEVINNPEPVIEEPISPEPEIDPKDWRTVRQKQNLAIGDVRIEEDLRLTMALGKFSPQVVWALQAYSILNNPELLYRCCFPVKETETRSGIMKKATTFLNNDDVKLIIEHSKKNFLSGDNFLPLERKKELLEKQEEDYVNGILDENGDIPEVDKKEMLRFMDKRFRKNPMDDKAADFIANMRFMKKQEETKEDDIFNQLTHFAIHQGCGVSECEFRAAGMCKGCFINRLSENELTDTELDWYENYMNEK